MATLPLDVEGVLAGVPAGDAGDGMAPGTRIGHVHLQVAAIPAAEAFYVGALGFEPTVRGYPGALFVSAGGYHHHVGLNTWAGQGIPAPPEGSRGLRSFEVVLPSEAALLATVQAAAVAGFDAADEHGRPVVTDPSGNRAVLTAP
jgi:catechol 2,3-dioxygenase